MTLKTRLGTAAAGHTRRGRHKRGTHTASGEWQVTRAAVREDGPCCCRAASFHPIPPQNSAKGHAVPVPTPGSGYTQPQAAQRRAKRCATSQRLAGGVCRRPPRPPHALHRQFDCAIRCDTQPHSHSAAWHPQRALKHHQTHHVGGGEGLCWRSAADGLRISADGVGRIPVRRFRPPQLVMATKPTPIPSSIPVAHQFGLRYGCGGVCGKHEQLLPLPGAAAAAGAGQGKPFPAPAAANNTTDLWEAGGGGVWCTVFLLLRRGVRTCVGLHMSARLCTAP